MPEQQPASAKPACAMCGKPVDPAYKPFCSKRCANLDLHRWLKGAYIIAGEPIDENDERAQDSQES